MRTRTQAGVVKLQKYDLYHLRLKGEGVTSTDEDPVEHGPPKPKRRSQKALRASWIEFPTDMERARRAFEHDINRPDRLPTEQRRPPIFQSPINFGDDDDMPLSIIQRADRLVEKMRLVLEAHKEHLPDAVPLCQRNLWDAEARRARIEDNEDNNAVFSVKSREEIVEHRIEVLEEVLASCKFDGERINLQCAMNGYKNGTIPYSERYTIIWAGKIVDTAKTYAGFTVDRLKRLDNYQKEHGDGWLWYEAGLKISPRHAPRLALCCSIPRDERLDGFGQYYVQQAFQKLAGFVCRISKPIPDLGVPSEITSQWFATPDGLWYCGQNGLKISFTSLLDSGASHPSLFKDDFAALSIKDTEYAAQTAVEYVTANGVTVSKCYELEVTVQDGYGKGLVNPERAVWPRMPHELGTVLPVAVIVEPQRPQAEGQYTGIRLSGMLPFLACYTSSAPTTDVFNLGEDRNDVLGAVKYPGQRRYGLGLDHADFSTVTWPVTMPNPKISFSHHSGQVIDRDYGDFEGASELIINGGTQDQRVWVSNPSVSSQRMETNTTNVQVQASNNDAAYRAAGDAILRLVNGLHGAGNHN